VTNSGENLATVLSTWAIMIRTGSTDELAAILDENVEWQGIQPEELCRNRAEVVHVLAHNSPRLQAMTRIEGQEFGDRVVVGFEGPEIPEPRFIVVAFDDGRIVRMTSTTDRDAAFRLAGA
jgi:hypothetical protein